MAITVKNTGIALVLLLLTGCGNGPVEVIKADSSITSASIPAVVMPEPINTDTTTAPPIAAIDSATVKKSADSIKHVAKKKVVPHKPVKKKVPAHPAKKKK